MAVNITKPVKATGTSRVSGTPGVKVKARGVTATVRALEDMGRRGTDATPAWPLIFEALGKSTERHWASRGSRKWPPLAEITRETKRRKHTDPRMMRVTGKLYESLTRDMHKRARRDTTKTQLDYGTAVFYAQFHHEGKGVPKRELVNIDHAARREINRILQRWLIDGQSFVRRPYRAK